MLINCLIFTTLFFLVQFSNSQTTKPNIIFILADDLGWNDVGYHNEQVISPNIDRLANEGITLERSYVQPICTPSRSSLMTGLYPYKLGRQGILPIALRQPTGLTLNHTLLPEYLKQAGYSTHLVGKWHLGVCKEEYLPTNRGFDTAFGYWNGAEDYYTKTATDPQNPHDNIYDFHFNNEIFKDATNYSMDLYTDRIKEIIETQPKDQPLFLYFAMQTVHTPLEVPKVYEDMYPNISQSHRKTYLGLVTAMDDVIGNVTEALKTNGMYENSIIIFVSDNGGLSVAGGGASNEPLRAGKGTFYEGGVRTPAFIHAPRLMNGKEGTINDKLIHITDWLPTILDLAQVDENDVPKDIDGFDQTNAIFGDEPSPRKMVVNEFSTLSVLGFNTYRGAIQIEDGWKLLMNPGNIALFDHYELYNVNNDEGENVDLKNDYPELFESMKSQIKQLVNEMVPQDFPGPTDADITDGQGNLATGWC